MIIGLTGKSCAGKDTVAAMLPSDSFVVIDVDALGHTALESNHEKLEEAFGPSIFKQDGSVDRKILGPMGFSDAEKLATLNDITHPWMKEEALKEAKDAEKRGMIAVINAALLESMGFVSYCDLVVFVTAPYEVREKEIGRSLFDYGKEVITIINDGDKDTISRQVSFLCAKI